MATATHAEVETVTFSTGRKDIWLWLWDGPQGQHRNVVFGFILRELEPFQTVEIWYPDELAKARKLLVALGHENMPLREFQSDV